MRSAFLRRGALGKPEVANTRAPVEGACRRIVLVRVIEGAIVHRINRHVAVIAPSVGGASLAAGAVKKMLFARQDVQSIGRQPACIAKLRVNRATGGTEA